MVVVHVTEVFVRRRKPVFVCNRYRNFRTLTSPHPAQFSSLAVDVSGELVSAGAQDSFEIFLWSMQTGRLLEVHGSLPVNVFLLTRTASSYCDQ